MNKHTAPRAKERPFSRLIVVAVILTVLFLCKFRGQYGPEGNTALAVCTSAVTVCMPFVCAKALGLRGFDRLTPWEIAVIILPFALTTWAGPGAKLWENSVEEFILVILFIAFWTILLLPVIYLLTFRKMPVTRIKRKHKKLIMAACMAVWALIYTSCAGPV